MANFLIVNAQGNETKLMWVLEGTCTTYRVCTKDLKDASDNLRKVLNDIVNAGEPLTEKYKEHLQSLMYAGESLKNAVFPGGDQADLLTQLLALPEQTPLTVILDNSVEVPWNFVFFGEPVAQFAPCGKIRDFKDFWHVRFKVRIQYTNSFVRGRSVKREDLVFLLALHRSRFPAVRQLIENHNADLHKKLTKLLQMQVGSVTDWLSCRAKWQQIREGSSIVYIFAHHDADDCLYLEEGEDFSTSEAPKYKLPSAGFSSLFSKTKTNTHSSTLCFINGCRTADGLWGSKLLSATSKPGFQGFIGTEAELPSNWATLYAVEFLDQLVGGLDVDRAYEYSRTACFPISLWYSCYADPQFKVV